MQQDYAEAAIWFRKAADQGDAVAQTSLGFMHLSGRGVAQDYVLAHMWFDLAAAQDYAVAQTTRDLTSRDMTPVQITDAQLLALEWKLTKER